MLRDFKICKVIICKWILPQSWKTKIIKKHKLPKFRQNKTQLMRVRSLKKIRILLVMSGLMISTKIPICYSISELMKDKEIWSRILLIINSRVFLTKTLLLWAMSAKRAHGLTGCFREMTDQSMLKISGGSKITPNTHWMWVSSKTGHSTVAVALAKCQTSSQISLLNSGSK